MFSSGLFGPLHCAWVAGFRALLFDFGLAGSFHATAGLAVSGVPDLFILATSTVLGTRAPARALLPTPWIATVGALPQSLLLQLLLLMYTIPCPYTMNISYTAASPAVLDSYHNAENVK